MNMTEPGGPKEVDRQEQRKLSLGAIVGVAGVAGLVVFILQNTDDVPVTFLAWDFTWPLYAVILISAALGMVLWIGFGIVRRHRRRKERRDNR